jgi:DDE family transposase
VAYPDEQVEQDRTSNVLSHHQNWRGRPLASHEVIIELIGATKTQGGLKIQAALDERPYAKGIKVSNAELATVQLTPDQFHGQWN